jgi:hypothetical protein
MASVDSARTEVEAADLADGDLRGEGRRLALLLAMAMFVFVIDTSLMNVSISAVVHDLDTSVSGVQSAITVEALVSAAFILIGSKIGDLIGRKRAYVLGLLLYVCGALSMVVAQSLAPIIIFWAVIGGLGASLYMPAMQSLIHGNFEGKAQAKAYALVGASAASSGKPAESKEEIVQINEDARPRASDRPGRPLDRRRDRADRVVSDVASARPRPTRRDRGGGGRLILESK